MISVSVIVPTFNRAHTLRRALTSVFGQTRPPDEVIVVDDASTDGTADVVREFSPRATLVRRETNGGAASARNVGIKMAQGEFIAFLDSDDVWLCAKLESQLHRIAKDPRLELVCGGIVVSDWGGGAAYYDVKPPANAEWSFNELQTYPFCPSTWLVKRSLLLEIGLFDETMANCEDLDLLARMISRRTVIGVVSEPLTVKYNHKDSLDANLGKTISSYAVLFRRYRELWSKAPRAAALSSQRLANMHIRAGDMGSGRSALVRAIRCDFWAVNRWLLLLLSLCGRYAYLRAGGWFQRWT